MNVTIRMTKDAKGRFGFTMQLDIPLFGTKYYYLKNDLKSKNGNEIAQLIFAVLDQFPEEMYKGFSIMTEIGFDWMKLVPKEYFSDKKATVPPTKEKTAAKNHRAKL